MQLKNIKVGGTYAWIDGYNQFSRPGRCFTNPDACPVRIISKKKVLVAQGKDSCGRDTDRKETVVVYKKYNIPASHMLAMDLDIIDEQHPELVTEVSGLKGKDVVWDWSKEVEKVRDDHRVKKIMSRYYDYIEGVTYRVYRWLMEEYGLTRLSQNSKVCRSYLRLDGNANSDLKVWLYDTIRGENDPKSEFMGGGYNHYGHHDERHPAPFLPTDSAICYSLHFRLARNTETRNGVNPYYHSRVPMRGECSVDTSARVLLDMPRIYLKKLRLYTKYQELRGGYYHKANVAKFNALHEESRAVWQSLDKNARLGILVAAINDVRDQTLKLFPTKTLPEFKNNRAWDKWFAAEKAKFYLLLPEAKPEV